MNILKQTTTITENKTVSNYRMQHPGEIEHLETEVHELGQLMGSIVEQIISKHGPVEGRKRIIALQRMMSDWQKKQ